VNFLIAFCRCLFENKRDSWVAMDIRKRVAPQYFQRAVSGLIVSFIKIIIAFLIAVILAQIQCHKVLAIKMYIAGTLYIAGKHMFNIHVITQICVAKLCLVSLISAKIIAESRKEVGYTRVSLSFSYCKIALAT